MNDMRTIERVREPKVYCGNRGRFNTLVEVRQRGVARPLELRLDLFNHSPTWFEWGYGGSGPGKCKARHDRLLVIGVFSSILMFRRIRAGVDPGQSIAGTRGTELPLIWVNVGATRPTTMCVDSETA
jgi:hypothetical protein